MINTQHNFAESLMYQLHESVFLIEKRLGKKLASFSPLTFSQFVILMGIICQEEAGDQSSLARFLHITEATVSRHISKLSNDGFIVKKSISKNVSTGNVAASKKSRKVILTDKGQVTFLQAQKVLKSELADIFLPLSNIDQQRIVTSMTVLTTSLLHNDK